MTDINITNLSLTDDHAQKVCQRVFSGISGNNSNDLSPSDFATISEYALTPQGKKSLKTYLNTNPVLFLHGLNDIEDSKGLILFQIIEKTDLVTVLSALKRILKHEVEDSCNFLKPPQIDSNNSPNFYLQLYYQISTEFKQSIVDDIPIFLGLLSNPGKGNHILVNVLLADCIRKSPQESSETLLLFYQDLIGLGLTQPDKLLLFFKSLDTVFMYDPVVGAKIYTDESALREIVSYITNVDVQDAFLRQVILSLLNLVSTSSMDGQCRTFTAKNYIGLLKNGTKLDQSSSGEDFELMLVLSTLCIVKTWNFKGHELKDNNGSGSEAAMPSIAHMSQILISALKTNDSEVLRVSLEGLTYLTLSAQVRKSIRMDVATVELLVGLMDSTKSLDSQALIFYALMVIFQNLSKIPEEKKDTKEFLKSYAQPKKDDIEFKETPDEIKLFNRSIIDKYNVVEKFKLNLVKVKARPDSRSMKLVISIIYSFTLDNLKSTRSSIVEQGGFIVVLEYLFATSDVKDGVVGPKSNDTEELATRAQALMILAKILILLNPKLIFGKYNLKSSVPFLLELLKTNDEGDIFQGEEFNNVQRLESLLALTNLSSDLQNKDLRTSIIDKSFDKFIADLLLETEIAAIQKAAWELVSNLISEPLMLAKFFNLQVKENRKRLEVLLNLISSTESDLQIVIAGLLANALSSFEMICEIILKDDELLGLLLSNIGSVLEQQSDEKELVQRLTYALAGFTYNLVESREYLTKLKKNDQIRRGLQSVARSGDPETMEYVTSVLQAIS